MKNSDRILGERLTFAMQQLERVLNEGRLTDSARTTILHVGDSLREARQHLDGKVTKGRCRFCGCSGGHGCMIPAKGDCAAAVCRWYDASLTVCSNPECLRKFKSESASRKKAGAKQAFRAEGQRKIDDIQAVEGDA